MKNLVTRFNSLSRAAKLNLLAIVVIVVVATITHGLNMFEYPYYENDEATYTSRGWSVIENGNLDPYTYRYDHPPVGWLTITGWQIITGGTLVFGSLLESARFLMLVLSVASSVLLYLTAKRLTGSARASFIAVLMLVISPLAVYFQRRILLDNIMSFFLIVSLFLASDPKRQLRSYQLSALTFGIAVLSKLTAVFAGPAILLMVVLNASRKNRSYAVMQWLAISGLLVALFVIYAMLKGEFLPAEVDALGRPENVSLIDTTREQLGRGEFIAPWKENSMFWQNMLDWLRRDAVFLVVGMYSLIASVLLGFKKRTYFVVSLYCLMFILFLARGKLVFNHYILPVLPGLTLAIAVGLNSIHSLALKTISFPRVRSALTTLVMFSVLAYSMTSFNTTPYTRAENENLLAAEQWITENVAKDNILIIDNYAYPRLHVQEGYENAFYMFPAEYDPDVRSEFDNDWKNIDYILVTHEIYRQMHDGNLPTIKLAFENSKKVVSFRDGSTSYIDDDNIISTNGDWADIYRVKSPKDVAGIEK